MTNLPKNLRETNDLWNVSSFYVMVKDWAAPQNNPAPPTPLRSYEKHVCVAVVCIETKNNITLYVRAMGIKAFWAIIHVAKQALYGSFEPRPKRKSPHEIEHTQQSLYKTFWSTMENFQPAKLWIYILLPNYVMCHDIQSPLSHLFEVYES